MFDFLREIAQSLRNNRLRTALTGIAVAWGIFMLIILLGAARGVVNAFESNFGESGANSIELYGGFTSKPFKGYKEGRRINLKGSDIDALEHDVKEVSGVMAFGYVDTAKIISTRDYVAGGLNAVFPEAAKNSRVTPTKGRFINNRDIDECRRVMVLHEKSAKTLFDSPDEAVGKTVKSMGLGWTVVGIYDHKWRSDTYIPYTTLQSLSGFDDKAYKLTAFVDGLTTEEEGKDAEEAIRKSLGKKHEFAADDRGAIWSWNEFTNYLEQQSAFVYLNLAVW
ncbi:MAG: ABC transporter permease, partial [Muribaculaceae bacterium]|nr:ABC transporter permease [Muribaculaceae bacterium]